MSTDTLITAPADGQVETEAAAAGGETLAGATSSTEGAETQPGSGEDSTAGTDTQAGEDSQSGQDTVAGAPDAYADFTAPDGIELDTVVLEDFKATAKELNLPQEAAQRVVDLGVALIQKATEQNAAAIAEVQQGWIQASKADPEFGGAKLNESLGLTRKALDKVGSPELVTLLNDSGLGNHPEIIRVLAKVGKLFSEDGLVTGSGDVQPQSAAKRIYPNMA